MHLAQHRALVIVFGQEGCPACTEYLPGFRAAAARFPSVPALAVDAARYGNAATAFGIEETPTTLLLSYGRPIVTLTGVRSPHDLGRLFTMAARLI